MSFNQVSVSLRSLPQTNLSKILPKVRQALKRSAEKQSQKTTSVAQSGCKNILQTNCVPSRMLHKNPTARGGAGHSTETITDEPVLEMQHSIMVSVF